MTPEPNPQLPPPPTTSPASPPRRFSIFNVLFVVVPVTLVVGAAGGWYYHKTMREADAPLPIGRRIKSNVEVPLKLDAGFTDGDNDLVADPPKDADKLQDPSELVFATLGRDEVEEAKVWKDFLDHVKAKTGKPARVVLNTFLDKAEVASLLEGKVHLLMFSTGTVPLAVNAGGFVPVCVMADGEGKFGYQVEIITPAKSPVQSLQDIRGRTLATMNFRSNSGFKYPVTMLWKELGLMPDRDYKWKYAGSPENSLRWIHSGDVDAAPMASDYLKRELSRSENRLLNPGEYRTIFTSKTFPPACFGHVHNLKPDLAAKVKDAFLSFKWEGTSLETAYKAANQSKFVTVNYKEHWAVVRDVDEQMMKFVEQNP